MPPNDSLAVLQNASGGRAPGILIPGDKSVRDSNGNITKFGPFDVQFDAQTVLETTGVIIGIYGDGGNGKTTFFCSICDRTLNPQGLDLPMVLLDAEAGIKSVAHLIGPDLQRVRIKSFTDLENFVDNWEATPKHLFPWKSVYLDNLSDMVQKALEEQGFHNQSKEGGFKTSSQPDYNAMTTRVTLCLHRMRDLAIDYGVNCFFSLWESAEKTESGTIIGYKADLTPKLAIRVKGILDWVGYLTIVNNPPYWDRKLNFSPNQDALDLDSKVRVRRGDEGSKVPLELYNPTLPDLLNTLKRGVPFPQDKYRRRIPAHKQ